MPKYHIRSRGKKTRRNQTYDQRGYADHLISQHSINTKRDFLDQYSYSETVNTLTPEQVADALYREYGINFDLWVMNRIHEGQVLKNAFGEGANDPKNPKPEELVTIL